MIGRVEEGTRKVGYDVQFVQVKPGADASFPAEADAAAKLMKKAVPIADCADIRKTLLAIEGAKPGPGETVDYLGGGLGYARFEVRKDCVHVDNNLGARDLLKIYEELLKKLPLLVIHDLQSGKLHDADSYAAWWSKPL